MGAVRTSVGFFAAFALVASACTSESAQQSTTSAPATTINATGLGVLASGSFDLPAADSFDAPGFHEVLEFTTAIPAASAGGSLIVRLRDVSRPNQTCDSEHPLSGCATVDWSDFEDRPAVPSGGVFDNRLSIDLADGTRTWYLSETGALADTPDDYSPG
jgi:hypothetical protein